MAIKMRVSSPRVSMSVGNARVVYLAGEPYEGEYEVTPSLNAQTMQTQNKLMARNVEIHPIPITKIGNNAGGNTIIIGE